MVISVISIEVLQWEFGSAAQGQGIDRQLHVGVLFLPRFGFVVEDVQVAVADLQEVDVACDDVGYDRTIVVRDLVGGQAKPLTKGFYPVYSGTGHVLFQTGAYTEPGLWALPYSAESLNPVGDPWRLSEDEQ